MFTLNNGILCLEIDGQGRLCRLENVKDGIANIITEPRHLFRTAIFRTADAAGMGENKEDAAFADEQEIAVSEENGTVTILVSGLRTPMGEKDTDLRLTVSLNGDGIIFGGDITNRSDSCLDELIYPCVGRTDDLGRGDPDLLWPLESGQRISGICRTLRASESRQKLHEMSEIYPGYLSMSWMALTDGENCLYMASYDPLFHVAALRAKGSADGGVTLEMNKMCFVNKGETWQIPQYTVRLYRGSWRSGADDYAAWARTWRHPVEKQDWIKKINGYFLVINKQQYGFESWPYDTIPELYDHAVAHGFDCLGLFGWYHTGHDNNYPDLYVSPTMGGEEKLRQGIRDVQKAGGHVTMYYQGHLLDPNSPFYKAEGHQWQAQNIWGTPYVEFYPKYCHSDMLRFFSRKCFATICPSAERWHDLMTERIDWIASFGADGALYDQIGGMPPYLCFDERHNHKNGKPSLAYTQGRLAMYPKIRARVAAHRDFAFMSEHITDLYSQYLDCVHGIGTSPTKPGSGTVPGAAGKAGTNMMPELFRYCFPETMITVRNPMPTMNERMVNYAFEYGFKFEMELRYDTDQKFIRGDEAPARREYAKKIALFRRRYEDYLLLGTFRADDGILSANTYANMFVTDDGRRAVALWNDSDEAKHPCVSLASGKITGWADVDGEGAGEPDTIPANGVMLLMIGG